MKLSTKFPVKPELKAFFSQSDIPFIVYAVVIASMAVVLLVRELHPDLTLNIFSELLGAAFTLFIIDTLLVRSRTRRWKVVREHINYQISRNVNRIRDGVSARAFRFHPELHPGTGERDQIENIRQQRSRLLLEMEKLECRQLVAELNEPDLFTEGSYEYFNEKSDDVWNLVNMKYSDYLAPDLVLLLMEIHTHLKDICAHIRQYRKAERFPEEADYYHRIGRRGVSVSLKELLRVLNVLKSEGYSEVASLGEGESADMIPAAG